MGNVKGTYGIFSSASLPNVVNESLILVTHLEAFSEKEGFSCTVLSKVRLLLTRESVNCTEQEEKAACRISSQVCTNGEMIAKTRIRCKSSMCTEKRKGSPVRKGNSLWWGNVILV